MGREECGLYPFGKKTTTRSLKKGNVELFLKEMCYVPFYKKKNQAKIVFVSGKEISKCTFTIMLLVPLLGFKKL